MNLSELVVANRVGSVPPEQLWVDALWRGAGAAFGSRALAQRALNRANAGIAELEATVERAQVGSALVGEAIVTAETLAAAAELLVAGLQVLAKIHPEPARCSDGSEAVRRA